MAVCSCESRATEATKSFTGESSLACAIVQTWAATTGILLREKKTSSVILHLQLLKTGSLDYTIRVFSLAMGHYTMLYKYGKRACEFLGHFNFYLGSVFCIFRALLIKQLFHSHLLNTR